MALEVQESPIAGPSTPKTTATRSRPGSPALSEGSNHEAHHHHTPTAVQAAALTEYLQGTFLVAFLPSHVEYAEKEAKRLRLETLARSVLPGARLLPFGSTANGFSLRNSDMDLCCLLGPQQQDGSLQRKLPSELVEILGQAIEKEPDVSVKMLPRARIPIIKLNFAPSSSLPFGLACDIGFENELALRNTRLLLTYAIVDSRLRTMVLFIKVWTKRRRINNPYIGTLSSYGYVLMVIHFLINVAQPPVLPNLQQIPPLQPIPPESIEFDGYNTYFFDDIELLPHLWPSNNNENVGDLLIAFFQYFARQFDYASHVMSIRSHGGLISKLEKGWLVNREMESEFYGGPRDLNRLCIEDPFQVNYNVARTVTRDGLYTIRHEINRALKMLSGATDRISAVVNELCEEREDVLIQVPPGASASGNRRKSAPSQRPSPAIYNGQSPMMSFAQQVQYAGQPVPGVNGGAPYYQQQSHRAAPYFQQSLHSSQFERSPDFSQLASNSYPVPYSTQPNQRYYSNRNTYRSRGNNYGYYNTANNNNHQYRRNQFLSSSSSQSSSPPTAAPHLERRSSWDGLSSLRTSVGSANATGQNQMSPPNNNFYYAPKTMSETGSSPSSPPPLTRPSQVQTAPTSPIFGASTFLPAHNNASSVAASSSRSTAALPHPRSQSHSSADRRPSNVNTSSPAHSASNIPRSPAATSSGRPASGISFGDFTSITSVMDAALAREEDRRRKGPDNIDAENEVIAFGDVRIFRRSTKASHHVLSRLGPRRPIDLPQVVEAVEINRPSTPLSPPPLPSAAPSNPPPVSFGARRLANGIPVTPQEVVDMAQSLSNMRASHA